MAGANGGAGPAARPGWRWDVALSFASAQRAYVEQVAATLQEQGMRCFYDADEQIELWGKYLAEELPGTPLCPRARQHLGRRPQPPPRPR